MSALAGPLLVTQVGNLLLGFVDTAIVGRVGEHALAAVGLGHTLFFTISVLAFGWILALDPLISQAIGASEPVLARRLMWQGHWVALIAFVPFAFVLMGVGELLVMFGIEERTAELTSAYLWARIPGLLPFLLLAAGRSFLQGWERTRPLVIGVIAANLLNLPASYLLVFGDSGLLEIGLPELGLPALGVAGAAVASALASLVQASVVAISIRQISEGLTDQGPSMLRPDWPRIWQIVKLGTPIGLQLLAEVGSFALVTVLMGNVGTRALSSHNVALMLVSTSFQIALAIGAAAAIRVGQAVGRGQHREARQSGVAALSLGVGNALLAAILLLAIPRALASILTDKVEVIDSVVPLLAVAAAFQLFDGAQAIAAGALRGAGDLRWPLLSNIVGHYLIGLPLGAGLALGLGWGATGFWWGLSAGLTAVAITLCFRFWSLTGRPLSRLDPG